MGWELFAAYAGMSLLKAGVEDQQTKARIKGMYQQAGWEEDYGDEILDQANIGSKRIKRVAYRKSIGIMNASASKGMQIRSQAERNASSLLVKAATCAIADMVTSSPKVVTSRNPEA